MGSKSELRFALLRFALGNQRVTKPAFPPRPAESENPKNPDRKGPAKGPMALNGRRGISEAYAPTGADLTRGNLLSGRKPFRDSSLH